MNNKIISLLGFSAKAGKLSFGYEAVISAIKTGKANLIVIAKDISEKTLKEVCYYADKNNVYCFKLDDIDLFTLSAAVGRKCGIVSVNDSNFATAIKAYE